MTLLLSDNKNGEKPYELPFIYFARIYAALAVVSLHTVVPIVMSYGKIPMVHWWLGNIIDSATRWAVPVFVMISGALLLDPRKQDSPITLYKKRLRRVGIPLLFWVEVYFFYNHFSKGYPLSLQFFIDQVILGQSYEHLNFLFIVLGLYLITPGLKEILKKIKQQHLFFMILLFLSIGIFWTETPSTPTLFIPYIGYYLAGFFLKNSTISYKYRSFIPAVIVLSISSIAIGTYLFVSHTIENSNGLYFYYYLNPLVILLAICVFLMIRNRHTIFPTSTFVPRSFILTVSSATFGIYLIHPLIQDILGNMLGITSLSSPYIVLGVADVITLTLMLSFGITFVIKQIPYLRTVV